VPPRVPRTGRLATSPAAPFTQAIDPFRGPELPWGVLRPDDHPWQEAYNLRLATNLYPAPGYLLYRARTGPPLVPAPPPPPRPLTLWPRSPLLRLLLDYDERVEAEVMPEEEWSAAYTALYTRLLTTALALEVAMEQDRPDVEATDAALAMVKAHTPLRLTFAETLWRRAGREPDIAFESADGELQHRARYAALYDFFFCDQPE